MCRVTTCQGLPEGLNWKKLLKALKKILACNGSIVEHAEHGKVLQLQGDQRTGLREFLVGEGIVSEDNLKVHGF